jgi:histidinol-phosphate aminotransferase
MSAAVYQKLEGRQDALALDMNECLVELPEAARAAFSDFDSAKLYAYPEYGELIKAMCEVSGVPAAKLRPTAGADEGISVTVQAFLEPGKRVALPDPCFSMYDVRAGACGALFSRVSLSDDWSLDPDAFIQAARGADLAVLISPGNPAGRAVAPQDVLRISRALDPAPLVIDEAYADFSGSSALGLLDSMPNAIILRSLSKSYGIAGLRVGYLVANQGPMERMDPFILPYGISRPSARVALSLLKVEGMPGEVAARVLACRASGARMLRSFFDRVDESDANFILAKVGDKAVALRDALASRGVLVKAWGSGRMAGWLRLTVFPDSMADRVKAAFEAAVGEVI